MSNQKPPNTFFDPLNKHWYIWKLVTEYRKHAYTSEHSARNAAKKAYGYSKTADTMEDPIRE